MSNSPSPSGSFHDTSNKNRKRSFQSSDNEIPSKQPLLSIEDEDYQLALKLSREINYAQTASKSIEDSDYELALKLAAENDSIHESTVPRECETGILSGRLTSKSTKDSDYQLALKLAAENDSIHKSTPRESENDILLVKSTSKSSEDTDYELALKLATEMGSFSASAVPHECKDDILLAIKLSQENLESDNINASTSQPTPYKKVEDSDYLLALELANANDANNVDEDDFLLAFQVAHEDLEKSQSSNRNETVERYRNESISVIDPSWEINDPNPDVYALFAVFNKRFFWGKLDSVELKWSPRMTLCAGICSYQRYSSKAGYCVVKLSKPLLVLRPRKDLVETLLHEMIHAYLFVTNDNRDHDDHGPQFHSHMSRINKLSGANITVYHQFHEEVKYYKNHWWKCDGPCKHKHPYYGIVKRATNRAPGPNDRWWNDHRAMCGGTFIKIKEPENYVNKKNKGNKIDKAKVNSLDNYFKPKTPSVPNVLKASPVSGSSFSNNLNPQNRGKKILSMMDLNTESNKSLLQNNSKQPDKNRWAPLSGQQNIFRFIDQS